MSYEDDVLKAKLALERELMVPLYRAMSAYIMAWTRNGGAPNIFERTGHLSTIERVLLSHYARVAIAIVGKPTPKQVMIETAAHSLKHADRMRRRAMIQSRRILDSLDRELGKQRIRAEDEQKADRTGRSGGFSVLLSGTMKTTAEQAHERAQRMSQTISVMETQEVSEESRYEWVKQEQANARIVKVWHNMGDERVRGRPDGIYASSRFDHWSCEGQEQFVDIPFNISGEQLQFPGDGSLGASLSNTINCRCTSRFFVLTNDGKREPLGLETPRIPAKRTWHPGDRMGKETPVNPTSSVTLNGTTRGKIVLGDGHTFANIRQPTPSSVEILVNRRVVARASFNGETVTSLTIAQGWEAQGMEKLIRDSVTHSARREWLKPKP
jgi:hypothetical protein